MESKIIKSDVLIIGSGGAGCRAAIEVSNEAPKVLHLDLVVPVWLKEVIMLHLD